ncbi:MAG: LysE family translocator [Arenicellales bacterium]
MHLSALAIFACALAVAAGFPGPSVAALVARVLVRGWRDVMPFAFAMWAGEALWLGLAIFGLSALAAAFHWIFVAVKYCGVAYLLFLAWKMWNAPVELPDSGVELPKAPGKMFLAGIAVTLGNPKIMVFYLALLPTIIDLNAVTTAGWLELTVAMIVVLAAIDIGYIVLAHRARKLLASRRVLRASNRISAMVFGGVAAMIASR